MLKKLLQSAVQNLVDPDRDRRRAELRAHMEHGLRTMQEKFRLSRDLPLSKYPPDEVEATKCEIVTSILSRAQSPGLLTVGERKTLAWVFRSLEISASVQRDCLLRFTERPFEARFLQAIVQPRLDPVDLRALDDLAATVGSAAAPYVAFKFGPTALEWAAKHVRMQLGSLRPSYSRLSEIRADAERLGIAWSDVLAAVQSDAFAAMERVLAEAKCDGEISQEEEAALETLISAFQLPSDKRHYVQDEIARVRRHRSYEAGHLPSLKAPSGIALRSGEIVHYAGNARLDTTKQRSKGPFTTRRIGMLVITDNRLLFADDEGAKAFVLRQIVHYAADGSYIKLADVAADGFQFFAVRESVGLLRYLRGGCTNG